MTDTDKHEGLNLDELLTDVFPSSLTTRHWKDHRGVPHYGIHCNCGVCAEPDDDEHGYCYGSVNIPDANGATENDADETGMTPRQEDYALRLAKTMAAAPQLLRTVKEQQLELFWLTDTMDESQRADTDNLKQRAVHPSIADFVQRLAEWGFNNCDNGYVWEAMRAVIEAGEKGDLDDLIGCYIEHDNGEAEAYFANKEAIE